MQQRFKYFEQSFANIFEKYQMKQFSIKIIGIETEDEIKNLKRPIIIKEILSGVKETRKMLLQVSYTKILITADSKLTQTFQTIEKVGTLLNS